MAGRRPEPSTSFLLTEAETWMPGTSPGMTRRCRNTVLPLYQNRGFVTCPTCDLIVAGAGGRMGRALTRVIAETSWCCRHRRAGGARFGTAGQGRRRCWRACRQMASLLSADLWSLSKDADGILDFTVPGATIANVAIAAERGLVHVIGTTGLVGVG